MIGRVFNDGLRAHVITHLYFIDTLLLGLKTNDREEILLLCWDFGGTTRHAILNALELHLTRYYELGTTSRNTVMRIKSFLIDSSINVANSNISTLAINGFPVFNSINATHTIYDVNGFAFNEFLLSNTKQSKPQPKLEEVAPHELYKINTIVRHKTHDSYTFEGDAGKILEYAGTSYGHPRYLVHFLSSGTDKYNHKDIIPTDGSFDFWFEQNGYVATVDCGDLFNKGERFLEKNGYLYNKSHSIILLLEKQKNNFTKNVINNDTTQTSINKVQPQKPAFNIPRLRA